MERYNKIPINLKREENFKTFKKYLIFLLVTVLFFTRIFLQKNVTKYAFYNYFKVCTILFYLNTMLKQLFIQHNATVGL